MRTDVRFALIRTVMIVLILSSLAGCASMNRKTKGAIIGAAAGGAVGGIIGKQSGSTAKGAIIGAVIVVAVASWAIRKYGTRRVA